MVFTVDICVTTGQQSKSSSSRAYWRPLDNGLESISQLGTYALCGILLPPSPTVVLSTSVDNSEPGDGLGTSVQRATSYSLWNIDEK